MIKFTTLTSQPSRPSGPVLPPFVAHYLAHGAPEGARNETIYKVAQQLFAAKLSEGEAVARIMPVALSQGGPKVEREVVKVIASAFASNKVVAPIMPRINGHVSSSPSPSVSPRRLGFIDVLRVAFQPGESVAVVEARQGEDGSWSPSMATIKPLEDWEAWSSRMGDVNKLWPSNEGGAFIGINPLKPGSTRRINDNVASFRHVLAEWEGVPLADQEKSLRGSGLPLTAIIFSGSRSVHGWVRVDAQSKEEWEKRRDVVFAILGCDPKNKDIARVSRCPGAMRGDQEQRVIAVQVGPRTWAEYEGRNAWAPVSWGVFDLVERGPEPPKELIRGILRQGCQMQISSGAKMRKSYTLLDLALSVAFGLPWLGLQTVRGPVFYADAENQLALTRQRIPGIVKGRGITLTAEANDWLRLCPLRGGLRGKTLSEIVAGVVLAIRSMPVPPVLAIMEPLYLLLRGAKEKEAEEVTAALEELDEVCRQIGCAIVYVHHFAKGAQGGKTSMDRASGSGALSRYPDAIVTLTAPEEPTKKGEAKADWSAMVSVDLRWFAKPEDFPIWWAGTHYETRKRLKDPF